MSNSMNKVFLLGNLGADPELRNAENGNPFLRFSLATTDRWRDRDDQWQERTEWHNVVLWGKRATPLHQILSKGMKVVVEGTIRSRNHERDGIKKRYTDIRARDVWLTASRPSAERDKTALFESLPFGGRKTITQSPLPDLAAV